MTALSGQSFESFGDTYCGALHDATCMASFQRTMNQENLAQSTMIGVGAGAVVTAGLVIGPQVAAACIASPTCIAAYTAVEIGGNAADVAGCASGDPLSCTALAINAITPGNFADEIADVAGGARTADDVIDAVPGGIGDDLAGVPNRTVPNGSAYSQSDYDAYVQRKLDAGETPRSPEDYVQRRQQLDQNRADGARRQEEYRQEMADIYGEE